MNPVNRCALIAACTALAFLAHPAPAQIVFSGENKASFTASGLDVNGDGEFNLRFGFHYVTTFDVPSSGWAYWLQVTPLSGSRILIDGFGAGIAEGTSIGPGKASVDWEDRWSSLISSYSSLSGQWSGLGGETGSGYVGFSFESLEGTHYGWVRIDVVDGPGPFFGDGPQPQLGSWAYETQPGVAITAGAIPEPAHLSILVGLAAIGFVLIRRRTRA